MHALTSNSPANISLCSALILTTSISIVKGGATQWVSLFWVTSSCLALIALFIIDDLKSTSKRNSISVFFTLPFSLFIAFQGWTIIQSLTLITQDLPTSLEHSLIGVGMLCLLAIWLKALFHASALRYFYIALILFTVLQSIYGLAILFSGANLILWMPKLHYLDRPTGLFVNANHFAAYLVLVIILMISKQVLVMKTRHDINHNVDNYSAFKLIDQIYNPSNLIIAFLFGTLMLTKSIGAFTALGVVLVLMACHLTVRHKQFKRLLLAGLLVLLTFSLFFLNMDYSVIEQELSGLSHTWWRRLELTQAAATMLNDHWLFGVGGGAFYSQFSAYRTLDIGNSYYNFAHIDLLQFWIEYGLVGISLLALFILAVLRENFSVLTNSRSIMRLAFAYTSIYGTIAVAIHSLVDFPLHIPGFSVLFIVIVSINSLCSTHQKFRGSTNYDD